MSRRVAMMAGVVFLVAATAACATAPPPPRKELVNTDFVGEHSVRYLLEKAGTGTGAASGSDGDGAAAQIAKAAAGAEESESEEETVQYYHLYVEVCDIGANSEENNCKSSKVLDTIVRRSYYGEDGPRRQVTDMFWNTSDTLFVSYLSPKPAVKSCRLKEDNTMRCADQPNINSLLNETKVETTEIGKGGGSSDESNEGETSSEK